MLTSHTNPAAASSQPSPLIRARWHCGQCAPSSPGACAGAEPFLSLEGQRLVVESGGRRDCSPCRARVCSIQSVVNLSFGGCVQTGQPPGGCWLLFPGNRGLGRELLIDPCNPLLNPLLHPINFIMVG